MCACLSVQRTSGVRHGRHSQVIILSAVPHSIRLATEAADEAGRALQRLRGETAGGCWGPDSSISPPATDSQCTCTFVRGASASCSCNFVQRGQCQLHVHFCSEGGVSASCTCTIVRGRGQCKLHVHFCQREGPVPAAHVTRVKPLTVAVWHCEPRAQRSARHQGSMHIAAPVP